jgi:polyhydroxyalkanoate synthesis regulator phasin
MPAPRSSSGTSKASGRSRPAKQPSGGVANVVEQLTNRILRPLGIVMLTRERIQETLDEAAARGRLTHSDANELVTELVNRGREQTDELLSDLERFFGRGRDQLESVTRRAHRADCRARPADDRRRAAVPDRRLRRSGRQAGTRAADGALAGRAAQAARVRAATRQPQDSPRGDRAVAAVGTSGAGRCALRTTAGALGRPVIP